MAARIKGIGDFLGNVHVGTSTSRFGRVCSPVAAHTVDSRLKHEACYSSSMPGFNGLRVLSFESRRAQEIAQLIRNNGGEPIIAPSTREIETPDGGGPELIRGILSHEFEAIIFTTGVGARALMHASHSI